MNQQSPSVLRTQCSVLSTLLVLALSTAAAAAGGDRFWRSIESGQPPAMLGARSVFGYARTLCEAREHPERLERVFQVAAGAQDRNPKSRGFGNLRWTWRDPGVTDGNAVEFCMQDALAIWIEHRQWVPEAPRKLLRELMEFAVEGCLRHRVPSSYTNIAILNAGNLLVLGEVLARPDVTAEGAGRLDAFYLWTWQFGTREFCSPTYYGTDLEGLRFIQTYAHLDHARQQARRLAELVWTDIAANWFAPAQKLAGAHSRSYDYLAGLGHLDNELMAAGWLPAKGTPPKIGSSCYVPGPSLRELSGRLPRLVRQHWGIAPAESRAHWLAPDITLSCSGAGSGQDDARLTVDLPGDRKLPRCYFIADGREDPYGKVRYETSTARHLKALHLQPFWAAAQRGPDALGLVVYRPQDLAGPEIVNLQSHIVLRAPADGAWLDGQRVDLRGRHAVRLGQPVVLRYGTAALGMRVPWARRTDGTPAEVALVEDGNSYGVVRLTVEHRTAAKTIEPAAVFWVRAGSGLAGDAAFDAWREQFEKAGTPSVQVSAKELRFAVTGQEGPVAVAAGPPFGQGEARLVPEPSTAALELDGREIGRPILDGLEPARSACASVGPISPLAVPAGGSVGWEAEAGLVFHGMATGADSSASGGRYVWQPVAESPTRASGSVLWAIRTERPGRYWLWGRASADNAESDSFYLHVAAPGLAWPARAAWHLRSGKGWTWQALALDKSRQAQPLDLPGGIALIYLRPREAGAKLDRLWLTTDPKAKPPQG